MPDQIVSPQEQRLDALLDTMAEELYQRLYPRLKQQLRADLLSEASGHVFINEARILLHAPDESSSTSHR